MPFLISLPRWIRIAALITTTALLGAALLFGATNARAGFIGSGEGPSGDYDFPSDDCTGNHTDPVGVLFRGKRAGINNVARHVEWHAGWWRNLGVASPHSLIVRVPGGEYECRTQGTANASQGDDDDRFHVRLWNIPASVSPDKKTVGTPHHEDWVFGDGCFSHAVDPNGSVGNQGKSGFDWARHQLRYWFSEAPPDVRGVYGNHVSESEYWGNDANFPQCTGALAGSDGWGLIIWLNRETDPLTKNASSKATQSTVRGTFLAPETPTEWWFGYGSSHGEGVSGYPNKTAVKTTSADAPIDVSDAISGLSPNTKYYVRLFTRNQDGEVEEGNEIQYSTLPTSTTTAVAHPLNGQPGSLGSIWVSGTVTSGGQPVPSAWVNVNFSKLENGQWVYKDTRQPTVTNGSYSTQSSPLYVGKGTWRVQTVLLPTETLEGSESGYSEFFIGDGYQLVGRHSGKCADVYGNEKGNGVRVHLWECLNPATSQNQVFSLIQVGSNWQLVARHSNRCLDVKDVSYSDGAWIQQWHCLGAGQTNQIWKWEDMGGGYSRFKAQHSGKCIEVGGALTGNGSQINQWDCSGTGTWQQWRLKSVESGPMKPDVTFHVDDILHGQPGYVNFSGKVNAAAYPLENQKVNIVFEKEVSPGAWQQLGGIDNLAIDGEGNFKVWYHGLSSGNWRGRAVYNSTSPLLVGNFSPNEGFEVKHGYRFKNRYSNRCLTLSENKYNNGQGIIQWDCVAPQPGNGQMLTFVPVDFGYFQLKFNHSSQNKCVDVKDVSYNNGAWLQAWDCYGAGQHNQVWQKIPIAGQEPWMAFKVKHSGKCADVTGPSPNNGVRIQQWDCHWGGNQQWVLEGVN